MISIRFNTANCFLQTRSCDTFGRWLTAVRPKHTPSKLNTLMEKSPNTSCAGWVNIHYRVIQTQRRSNFESCNSFARSASVQPEPLAHDHTSLLLEYVEGAPQYKPDDVASFVRQIAVQLAAIHKINGGHAALKALPRSSREFPSYPHKPHLKTDSIAATLAKQWPPQSHNAPVLLHGDFWPGNLIWRDSELAAIIDWEDAMVGDPLEDLAICRFDVGFIFGRNAPQLLTDNYLQHNPIDTTSLPFWDLLASLRILNGMSGWAAGWAADLGRPDITLETIEADHRWFVDQAMKNIE